jgi:hypothetical protein
MNDCDAGVFEESDLDFLCRSTQYSRQVVDEVQARLRAYMGTPIDRATFDKYLNCSILDVQPANMPPILRKQLKLLLRDLERRDKGYTRAINTITRGSLHSVYNNTGINVGL